MPLNYDALTATTRRYFIKPLQDQVFNELPLLQYLTRGAQPAPGGTKLVQPLIYAANTNRGSYRGYEPLGLAPTDEITAAEWDWKQLYVSVTISGLEEAQNRGDLAVLNLLRTKMEIAKQSLKDMFAEQVLGDGTGNGGKDLDGLAAGVDDGTLYPVYGGIDRIENPWWQAHFHDAAGAPLRLSQLSRMITAVSDGADSPDLIVMEPDLWDSLLMALEHKHVYGLREGREVNVSWDRIRFRSVDVIWERKLSGSGTIYILNSRYVKLRPHVEYRNFKDTGWKKPINQDAAAMQILWYGNLTISNCRRLAKIVNVSEIVPDPAPASGA